MLIIFHKKKHTLNTLPMIEFKKESNIKPLPDKSLMHQSLLIMDSPFMLQSKEKLFPMESPTANILEIATKDNHINHNNHTHHVWEVLKFLFNHHNNLGSNHQHSTDLNLDLLHKVNFSTNHNINHKLKKPLKIHQMQLN